MGLGSGLTLSPALTLTLTSACCLFSDALVRCMKTSRRLASAGASYWLGLGVGVGLGLGLGVGLGVGLALALGLTLTWLVAKRAIPSR